MAHPRQLIVNRRGSTVSVIRITKDDERYEALSQGFNQRWTATPDYIAMAASTEDVVAAVGDAVSEGKRISVRSGGHCYENFVSNAEVQVIVDVSGLDQVYRDEGRDAFCLGAGATNWRLYTHLYRPFGVTMPGGSCYSVGAGGHISAGGFGLLSRQFGLTVDYLHAVEVVVVDQDGKAKAVIAERDDKDPPPLAGLVLGAHRWWRRELRGDHPLLDARSPPATQERVAQRRPDQLG
jgi:FAD/FMN-containing dehydrogenase